MITRAAILALFMVFLLEQYEQEVNGWTIVGVLFLVAACSLMDCMIEGKT